MCFLLCHQTSRIEEPCIRMDNVSLQFCLDIAALDLTDHGRRNWYGHRSFLFLLRQLCFDLRSKLIMVIKPVGSSVMLLGLIYPIEVIIIGYMRQSIYRIIKCWFNNRLRLFGLIHLRILRNNRSVVCWQSRQELLQDLTLFARLSVILLLHDSCYLLVSPLI